QRSLAVAHPEHLRRAGGRANVVERGGDVFLEIGVEGPAARRVLPRRPRGSVAAQVDGEAVEACLGKSARDGVPLDAEVQVAAIGGEPVAEENGRKARLSPRRAPGDGDPPTILALREAKLVLRRNDAVETAPEGDVKDGEREEDADRDRGEDEPGMHHPELTGAARRKSWRTAVEGILSGGPPAP